MTVLTFPSNPIEGQVYNAPNGIRYVYDGVKWVVETTTSTSEAVTNSTQDRVAPMFVNGDNQGITFTYDAATNTMSAEVTAVNGNRLVNGVHEVVLNSSGVLQLADDIRLPTGGRWIKDCGNSGTTTSMRWINVPTTQEVQLFRIYTGDPAATGALERGAISLEWPATNVSGLSLTAFDRTDGEIIHKWVFNGDGTITLPTQTVKRPEGGVNTAHTLALTTSGNGVIITQEETTSDNTGDNFIRIQGQRGYGTFGNNTGDGGYGGNVEIYGGQGGETGGNLNDVRGGEGGYVDLRGGDGQTGRNGGPIYLRGGDAVGSIGYTGNVTGGNVEITAGYANNSIEPNRGSGGDIIIQAGSGNALGQHGRIELRTDSGNWQFTQTGELRNSNSFTKTFESNLQGQAVTQVVWTSTQNWISGVKLLIQVEANEIGDTTGWHSQVCEAVIASRGYANSVGGPLGEPQMTVYGVTHTSVNPLITFTVDRNPTTNNIEVVATRTAAVDLGTNVSLRIYSVETGTRD